MYDYDVVYNSPLIIFYYFIYLLSFLIFFIFLSNKKIKIYDISDRSLLNFETGWDAKKIRVVAYVLSVLSLSAGIFNLLNADSFALLFLNARLWEESFGKNFVTNYIYFLHLPALVIFGFIVGSKWGIKNDRFLIFLLLFSTTWHGIKFTILHGFIFYLVGFYIANREFVSRKIAYVVSLLIAILIAFFVTVRGGGVEGFVSYIVSPAINSMYYINNHSQLEIGGAEYFNPLKIIQVDKIQRRVFGINKEDPSEFSDRGFVLNSKYNLQNAITTTNLFYGLGFLFYSLFFAVSLNYLRSIRRFSPLLIYGYAILIDVIVFLFTAFELFKTKLWSSFLFLVVVSFIVKRYTKDRPKMNADVVRSD